MIRRPPRSTQSRSSAASDVYKRQHLYNGQEAISTGVIGAMKKKHDWFCSTYRDHVHALSAGVPSFEVMSELFGKSTGCSKGRGGSMHLFSREHHLLGGYAFIGEGIPVALGAAFSSKYKKEVAGNSNSCLLYTSPSPRDS